MCLGGGWGWWSFGTMLAGGPFRIETVPARAVDHAHCLLKMDRTVTRTSIPRRQISNCDDDGNNNGHHYHKHHRPVSLIISSLRDYKVRNHIPLSADRIHLSPRAVPLHLVGSMLWHFLLRVNNRQRQDSRGIIRLANISQPLPLNPCQEGDTDKSPTLAAITLWKSRAYASGTITDGRTVRTPSVLIIITSGFQIRYRCTRPKYTLPKVYPGIQWPRRTRPEYTPVQSIPVSRSEISQTIRNLI